MGPGRAFFDAIRKSLGSLPLVAEDLGEITPDVVELRSELGIPTVLGVSNVSHGLPDRGVLNASFLAMAMERGLDAVHFAFDATASIWSRRSTFTTAACRYSSCRCTTNRSGPSGPYVLVRAVT